MLSTMRHAVVASQPLDGRSAVGAAALRRRAVAQARMFVRNPAISVISIALPLMLFAFFGLPAVGTPYRPGVDLGTFMLASFAAYAVSRVMVFNYGITIALDRGQKIDVLVRSTPLPGTVFLAARTLTALAFGMLALVVLFAFAAVGRWVPPARRRRDERRSGHGDARFVYDRRAHPAPPRHGFRRDPPSQRGSRGRSSASCSRRKCRRRTGSPGAPVTAAPAP